MRILESLGAEELRLMELAQRVKLHKATVTRLLASLERANMVSRENDGRYRLGPGVLMLATTLLTRYRTVVDYLRPALVRLWEATGETVTVHVREALERVCVEELESPQRIAFRSGIGSRVPVHVSSSGKVLLAFTPSEERELVLERLALVAITPRTITSRVRLEEQLETIRRRGYAVSAGERTPGAVSVSVPVLDASGDVIAAASVIGPEARMTPARQREYVRLLQKEIERLPVVASRSGLIRRM